MNNVVNATSFPIRGKYHSSSNIALRQGDILGAVDGQILLAQSHSAGFLLDLGLLLKLGSSLFELGELQLLL
jgi:hypothetical protein